MVRDVILQPTQPVELETRGGAQKSVLSSPGASDSPSHLRTTALERQEEDRVGGSLRVMRVQLGSQAGGNKGALLVEGVGQKSSRKGSGSESNGNARGSPDGCSSARPRATSYVPAPGGEVHP